MSSGVCEQCGAHRSVGGPSLEVEAPDAHLICPECGAPFGTNQAVAAAEELSEAPSAETSVADAPSATDVSVEPEANADEEPVSAATASLDSCESPASDEAPTLRAPDVEPDAPDAARDEAITARAPDVDATKAEALLGDQAAPEAAPPAVEADASPTNAEAEPDRDSSIPIESHDFVAHEAPRQRRLPTAPARRQAPKADGDWLDELPMSVGTPTLAALVQRANSEGEKPAPPSIPPELLTARAFDLAASDWDARLRTPATDAPVTGTSAAPGPAPTSRKSLVVVITAVAAAAFAAGLSVKRSEPAATASLPAPQRAAEASIQAAKPALAPPDFAIEPAAPEQSPAALPPAEGAPSSSASRAPASDASESSASRPLAIAPPPPAAAATTARATAAPKPEEQPSSAQPAGLQSATAAPPSAELAFDAQAAEAAIGAAAARATSCKEPGSPSGVAVVTITFSPSGRATTANIAGPPFAGTATGGCIAATLRGARVPAFSGEFVTVKKSVTID